MLPAHPHSCRTPPDCCPLKPPLQAPPRVLRPLVAEQLMSSPAEGLPCIVPVAAAEALLRR